ncbi:class I SAM-dependent methyltransferase [Enterococcus larvae]|uniref:class I SAM-dependent methyltransferase n=1 Tax=Enterococcus larvae TaxID=2794352 RepID=UPI003F36B87E
MNKELCMYQLPQIYQKGTESIWTDPYISGQLLQAHLDPEFDGASRKRSFIDASADWIEEQFPQDNHSEIIDFGCGPGLYTERMAEKGYTVTGIDFSKRSIEKAIASANKQQLPIRYIHGDYLSWQPEESYDLALLIYCDYGALSKEERKTLLKNMYETLKNGGQLLMDNFTTTQLTAFNEETSWSVHKQSSFWAEGEHVVLNRSKKYEENTVLEQAIVLKENEKCIYNIWKYFSTEETLTRELEEAGFTVKAVYKDVVGRLYEETGETLAIVAEK